MIHGKYNFNINVTPKTTANYMNFTIRQPKKKEIRPGLLLVFTYSVRLLNNSLDNLVGN